MASALHKEDDEIDTECGNIPLTSARSRAEVRVTPAVPGRKLLRVVAVSFGLLCVLQATLNVCLRLTLSHQREENQQICNICMTEQQEIKSHNLTRERDQLQASYNNLTRERDQLQASYNNLTRERDQLQASYNNLTRERDQLQASYNNLTRERDQLQASYNNLTRERDQLQASYNNLTRERDQLQASYNNLVRERDQLQASYNNLTRERDQLQASYNNLTRERDQLQASYNNLTRERDQLQASYNNLVRERDQLQARNNYLNVIIGLRCPQDWHKFQSSCYLFSASKKSWEESRRDCLQRGADLVIINSRGEQAFLQDLESWFWIGLSDMYKDGQWRWVDGLELINGFWAPGEPNNAGEDECAEFIKDWDGWNDVGCSAKRLSVCEKHFVDVPQTAL